MKNYVLCTTLDDESLETLKKLKGDISLNDAKIHVITIIEKQVYTVDLAPYVYPVESQYPSMESSALGLLKSVGDALGIDQGNLVCKCFFEYDREKAVKEYLQSVHADLVVVATRGKHGLEGFFSSSFTDYLCKFSPCDVLVMRPRK
jgi:nucleotide-binding universal stress UspA family protein